MGDSTDDDPKDVHDGDLEDFLLTSLFTDKHDELYDDYVPNLTKREFGNILLENLGMVIKSEAVIDEMFAECSNISNGKDRSIEVKDLIQYMRRTDKDNSKDINHFTYVSANFFKSISNWMSAFFFTGSLLGVINQLIQDPKLKISLGLSTDILFLIGTMVFAVQSYERFEDQFDHNIWAKRMLCRWYKQFFVLHMKMKIEPSTRALGGMFHLAERFEDLSDRISFSDFFMPNSLSGNCLDKLQTKQGVNISELILLLEASSIFIQQDVLKEMFIEIDLDGTGTIDLNELKIFAEKMELENISKLEKTVSVLRKSIRSMGFWSTWVWFVGSISYIMVNISFFRDAQPKTKLYWSLLIIGDFSYFFGGVAYLVSVYSNVSKYFSRIGELEKALLSLCMQVGRDSRDRKAAYNQVSKKTLNKIRKTFFLKVSFAKNILSTHHQWTHNGRAPPVNKIEERRDEENVTSVDLDCILLDRFQLHNILFQHGILIELDIFTRAFQKADIKGDGVLSIEEFSNFVLRIKEGQEVSCKHFMSKLMNFSFFVGILYVAAGLALILKRALFFLKFSSTLIKGIAIFSSGMYAVSSGAGLLQGIRNLSSKFYTIQDCRIGLCDAIFMRASMYADKRNETTGC